MPRKPQKLGERDLGWEMCADCAGHQRKGKVLVTCPQWPVCSPLTAPHCVLQWGYKLNLSAWDNFNLNIPLLDGEVTAR